MIALAQYGLVISFAALAASVVRRRPYQAMVWLAPATLLAAGLDLIAGRLLFDTRPFVVLHVVPLIAHSGDNGFPSDHSTVAAFVAAALWFIDLPSAAVATLAAVAIGLARIYCLVHWPLDVTAGWCIGALPAIAAGAGWRKYGSLAGHPRL